MTIPTYDKCMLPLLHLTSDGNEYQIRAAISALADYFELTEEELEYLLPSGKDTTFSNRVRWASTYLKKARLLESTGRGKFRITERGLKVLENPPEHVDWKYLLQFPSFAEFQDRSNARDEITSIQPAADNTSTPQETLHSSFQRIRDQLAQDLLDQIMTCSPSFFERLVVDLLLAMGYGRSLEDAGQIVGRSGDGGVDGIISEDKLGFDVIYVQAKRWDQDSTVGRPTVQAFAGSLLGQGVAKGMLITTSRFSREAIDYTRNTPQIKIVLIDGQQLAELMIDHDIGVSPEETYTIKKIDQDYFEPE